MFIYFDAELDENIDSAVMSTLNMKLQPNVWGNEV